MRKSQYRMFECLLGAVRATPADSDVTAAVARVLLHHVGQEQELCQHEGQPHLSADPLVPGPQETAQVGDGGLASLSIPHYIKNLKLYSHLIQCKFR